MRRGLWQAGMVISLAVHGLVYGVGRAVVVPAPVSPRGAEAEFLGNILTREDLEAAQGPSAVREGVLSNGWSIARSRGASLERLASPAQKPIVQILRPQRPGADLAEREEERARPELPAEISIDLSRASAYLRGLEVRDLFRAIDRLEIRGEVVLDISYAASGRILRVSKVLGSGNPVLDDSLVVRVQESVVAGADGRRGRIRLRLRLR